MKHLFYIFVLLLIGPKLTSQEIVQIEYFFDTDPGFGSATQIAVTPDSIIEIQAALSLAALSNGFHTLYVRTRDTLGNWSFVQNKAFIKDQYASGEPVDISTLEYYFDTDPGLGSATQIPLTPDTLLEVQSALTLAGLNPGIHTLHVRVQNAIGNWSFVQNKSFIKDQYASGGPVDITSLEYYFDTDPGLGSATQIPVTADTLLEVKSALSLANLNPGIHTIYVRAKNAIDNWSIIQYRSFIKDQYATGGPLKITDLEYFIDADPGLNSATTIAGISLIDVTRDTVIALNDFDIGGHTLYSRAKNEADRWSFPQKQSFLFDDERIEFAEFKFDSISAYSDWTSSNPFARDFDITTGIDFEGICDLDSGWYYIEARVRRKLSWWSNVKVDSIEIKDFYDFTGDITDQFGDSIPDATMYLAGADTLQTDNFGGFSTLVPKCWGDTISAYKDLIYSSAGSFYFGNPLIDLRAKLVLGDIDTSLFGYKCQNLAGTTSENIAYVCEGANLIVNRSGEYVDTGSITGYILHDGLNTLGTIFEYNIAGSFTNDGSYPRNQKLYISSIVGRPNIEIPDINHVCTDIEFPGRPVVFLNIQDTSWLQLDSTGQISMDPTDLLIAGCATCDIDTTSMSQSIFGCADHGVNSETVTVDDGNGHMTTCNITIIISDTIVPAISCRADTLVHTDPGVCTFTPLLGLFDPTSIWDNCPTSLSNDFAAGMSLNNIEFPLGDHTIKWTIDDGHGNLDSCNFTITVEDHEVPQISCPAAVTVSTNLDACTLTVTEGQFDPLLVSDNCTALTFDNDSNFTTSLNGEILELGSHLFRWTVDDQHGQTASCVFMVLVEDNQLPAITCSGDANRNTNPGLCTYTIVGNEFDPVIVSDNCFDLTYSNNAIAGPTLAGIVLGLGDSTFNWTVNDQHGNTAMCSVTVTVEDNQAPEISCPANTTVSTNLDACTFEISGGQFDPLSVTDNCTAFTFENDSNFTTTLNGEILELGIHTMTWTVDDQHGQTASCVLIIEVEDNQVPMITCPENGLRSTNSGECTYTIIGNEFNPLVTSDNCFDFTFINDANASASLAGVILPQGDSTIVWTIDDQHGNTALCSLSVTVEDNELPEISCPVNVTVSTNTDQCTHTVTGGQFDPLSVSDNCAVFAFENDSNFTTSLNGEILELGTHLFKWTVDDQHGQIAFCEFTVFVEDNQSPGITCPADVSRSTDLGQCTYTISSNEFDPITLSDNCIDYTYSNDANAGTTLDGIELGLGDSTFTWTISDLNGNTAVCSLTVTIEDNEAPTIICQDSLVRSNDTDACSYLVTINEFTPVSVTDNCNDLTFSNNLNATDELVGIVLPHGAIEVIWTVDDAHGQTSVCSQIITVIDTQPPIISCPLNVTLEIGRGVCDTLYYYNVVTSDNCSGEILTLTDGLGDGQQFSIGTTNEGYSVTDTDGNTAVCDFEVTVNQLPNNVADTICFGDSMFLANSWQYFPGFYVDTFTNVNGCDSVVNVSLDTTTYCIWPSVYVYVDSAASGSNTGVDWVNAYLDLQLALDVARRYFNITKIWVAKGTYYPTSGLDRLVTYELSSDLEILAGFSGIETNSAQRNIELNQTTLSGNIGNPLDSLDNSRHIISSDTSVSNTLIDGFIVLDGYASFGSEIDRSGGGLINLGEVRLSNMTFRNCSSVNYGSAIMNLGHMAHLTLTSCVFINSTNGAIRNSDSANIVLIKTNDVD